MASTKLTLLVDRAAAARAKRYSKRHGTSVSRLVSQMFDRLPEEAPSDLPSSIKALAGILPGTASVEDHRRHLRRKYRL
ncbi:MAG: hypothetical protein FJX59_00285 [Alphaproteobacteria bacterium]|nr:hypothetical protein [Alphaproteobacteria bacterium]